MSNQLQCLSRWSVAWASRPPLAQIKGTRDSLWEVQEHIGMGNIWAGLGFERCQMGPEKMRLIGGGSKLTDSDSCMIVIWTAFWGKSVTVTATLMVGCTLHKNLMDTLKSIVMLPAPLQTISLKISHTVCQRSIPIRQIPSTQVVPRTRHLNRPPTTQTPHGPTPRQHYQDGTRTHTQNVRTHKGHPHIGGTGRPHRHTTTGTGQNYSRGRMPTGNWY